MSLTPDTSLASLLERPVAVFGGGVSGRTAAALICRLGGRATLFDERPGEGCVAEVNPAVLRLHGLAIVSPGFNPGHPWLALAQAAHLSCWSELDLAARLWKGRILAVTGTNGKTTLTEFLTHALRTNGETAHSTGNIGHSFCRLVADMDGGAADTWAVCEVSSFQAESLTQLRADAVLWTNFAEDHLERHPGMEAYFAAKQRLFACLRTDAVVLVGSSVVRQAEQLGRTLPADSSVVTEALTPDPALSGTVFERYPQRENFVLARAWWLRSGRPEANLLSAARTFSLGRHRLSRLGEHAGVTWWNDSKATNFHAVEAALGCFAEPVLLIAGGKSKGGDLAAFVRRIAPRVRHAFLLGETRGVLASFCAVYRLPFTLCDTLEQAVLRAGEGARPGDNVLLSPGFASFDMFRGYDDRGSQFEQLVRTRFLAVASPVIFN